MNGGNPQYLTQPPQPKVDTSSKYKFDFNFYLKFLYKINQASA